MLRAAIVASAASLSEGAVVDVKSILNVSRVAKAGFDRTFHSVTALMGSSGSGGADHGECHHEEKSTIQGHIATALCTNGDAFKDVTTQAMWDAIKTNYTDGPNAISTTDFAILANAATQPSLLGADGSSDLTVAVAGLVTARFAQAAVTAWSGDVGVKRLIAMYSQMVLACTAPAKDVYVDASITAEKDLMVCECVEEGGKVFAKMCADFPANCAESNDNPPVLFPSDATGAAHEVQIPVSTGQDGVGIKATMIKHCQHFLGEDCAKDHDIYKGLDAWLDTVNTAFTAAWETSSNFVPVDNTFKTHTGCYWNEAEPAK